MPELLLDSLRAAVRSRRFDEQVLLSGDSGAARTLLRRLAMAGTPWVNVRCATLTALARELAAAELDRRGLAYADGVMTLLMTADLVRSIPEAAAYLRDVASSPGTLRAVHRSLTDLRLHGVQRVVLGAAVPDPGKRQALTALLEAFDQTLAARRWADDAEVFRLAAQAAAGATGRRYLVPAALPADGLARYLLDALPADCVDILPQDEPGGLAPPNSRWSPGPGSAGDGGPLAHLFDGGGPVPEIQLFSAVAAAAEVREVLRRMVACRVTWEDAELLIARDDPYLAAIHEAAGRLSIPVTSATGTPTAWTRPGRAATTLLAWLKEGFPARRLADALAAGDLRLPPAPDEAEVPGGSLAARLLRRAAIGWGRDRYGPGLLALRGDVPSPAATVQDGGDAPAEPEWAAERRRQIDALRSFVAALFDGCPVPDAAGLIALADVCRWAAGALERCAGTEGENDRAASHALVERLRLAARWAGGSFSPGDASDHALALIADLRVGASLPAPGHLHVAPAAGGACAGRAHTYVLGLDEASFAPGGGADPLLLDEERAALSPALPGSSAVAAERLYRLGLKLASLRGSVCLSYSVREGGTSRSAFPSPVLLQAFRLLTGRADAGYAALEAHLGPPVGYFPAPGAPPLDQDEVWLGGIAAAPVLADARAAVLDAYPHLARGEALREARNSSQVTAYDGQIEPDPERLDPRRNRELVVSASRLEQLARCPLAYMFRYVLGVVPLEEVTWTPGRWLDPMRRGSLLHTVYRRFYERLGGAVRGEPAEERVIDEVCAEAIAEVRKEVPPPMEAVYERERDEIQRAARLFLEIERRDGGRAQPAYFELPFGLGPDSVPAGSAGSADPVEVDVGGGGIRVRGQIDRVDRLGDHVYSIWDYKTGRPFDEGGTVLRGRRVQHALYAEVLERLLRASGDDAGARVEVAGYRFPTERGEGRTWLPEGGEALARRSMGEAVSQLLDLVASGTFVAAEDADACAWCDFRAACDAEEAAAATKRKLAEADNVCLHPLRRLASLD